MTKVPRFSKFSQLGWTDIGAGMCVAGLLIPEAVAYAGLAGLPVISALTATLTGLTIYAIFGGSRFAIVAPTSSTATLSAAAVLSISGTAGPSNFSAYFQALIALVLLTGLALALLALTKQGQLSAFVSRPVLRGFAFALAITIVLKQLPDVLGLVIPNGVGSGPFQILAFAMAHTVQWHLPTIAVAIVAGLILIGLKRWPKIPGSMVAIVVAIALANLFNLKHLGVEEVGTIAAPVFHFEVPHIPVEDWLRLTELAGGLVVLVFAESWGSMRTLALASGESLDANKELLVLGACNIASSLLGGMAVGAGFSATSANAAAGASSRRSGVAALAVIAAALIFALPALHFLPRAVLAVAVINALWHALSVGPLLMVWRMNRDRLLLLGSVMAVLFLGVLYGMLAAIALSLVAALRRFSQPIVHELGELGSSRNFVVLDGHTDAAAIASLLILRPEEPLFFASAERVTADVMRRLNNQPDIKAIVLSLEESADLDSTAGECLLELDQRLRAKGKVLLLARVKDSVRELLTYLDPGGVGRHDRMFWSVADAVAAAISATSNPIVVNNCDDLVSRP